MAKAKAYLAKVKAPGGIWWHLEAKASKKSYESVIEENS
jgi:hypothetical protein